MFHALLVSAFISLAQEAVTTPAPARAIGEHDRVIVTTTPLGGDPFEQTQPVSILTGEELKLRLEPTIGETLSREAGVSSTYFGPGASRPVIRGLGEDRIRVLQNGVSTIDASNISPDHAAAVEPLTIRTIDVVRGPATLLYGPNTIGGVVNVIDNRVPIERLARPIEGRVEGRYGSAEDLRSGAGVVEFGLGPIVIHLDGFIRETSDIEIPGYARSRRLREMDPRDADEEPRGVLPNSFTESYGGAGGASYIWDGGYIGGAFSGLDSRYGVIVEEDVTIELEQLRWDLRGAFNEPFAPIKAINYKFSYSDYTHTEFEGAEVGTVFDITGYEGRLEIVHQPLGAFEGVIGYQGQVTDLSALGEEAFLPPIETVQHGVFVFEELTLNPVRLQFGLRYDHHHLDSSGFADDRHEQGHDHDDHHHAALARSFHAVSASAGILWTPVEPWVIAFSLAYTQRPPTGQELFSDGPHIATGSFELGDPTFGKEESLAFDLSLRRKVGRITGSVNFFYNRFNNFITALPTGEFADDPHGHHEEDEDDHAELPIFAYRAVGADFIGGELNLTVHILEPGAGNLHDLHVDLRGDYVWAENRDAGRSLARITPFRTSAALVYGWSDRFTARVEGQYVARQNRTAEFELPTDDYFLLNASASYRIKSGPIDWDLFVRGTNLTNAEARVHTSFLKDIAPLPGRGALVGLRATF